jgi:hypothetical protein
VLACSDATLRQVVQRWPGIAALPARELMARLLALKAALPRCNVAAMATLQPALFLGRPAAQLAAQVGGAYAALAADLPLPYVDAMVQVRACWTAFPL